MPSIKLTNIPDELYERLGDQARRHGKSVEEEALRCIDAVLRNGGNGRQSIDADLKELDRFRESLGTRIFLTEDDLQRAKREGRE
jgi:plasmid stability protein